MRQLNIYSVVTLAIDYVADTYIPKDCPGRPALKPLASPPSSSCESPRTGFTGHRLGVQKPDHLGISDLLPRSRSLFEIKTTSTLQPRIKPALNRDGIPPYLSVRPESELISSRQRFSSLIPPLITNDHDCVRRHSRSNLPANCCNTEFKDQLSDHLRSRQPAYGGHHQRDSTFVAKTTASWMRILLGTMLQGYKVMYNDITVTINVDLRYFITLVYSVPCTL